MQFMEYCPREEKQVLGEGREQKVLGNVTGPARTEPLQGLFP